MQTVNGKNSVFQASSPITFTKLRLVVYSTVGYNSNTLDLCMDSYHAWMEYYLNPFIVSAEVFSFATIGVNYTDPLTLSGSMFDT
jgi:hypothetical protein